MPHIQGVHRDAVIVFPPTLDEYITTDNPVRCIDAFVDQLDLHALGFRRALANHMGRPAYAPGDLLKLYLYGYLNRIRSSRMLERCKLQFRNGSCALLVIQVNGTLVLR